jgi:hypothetical protein
LCEAHAKSGDNARAREVQLAQLEVLNKQVIGDTLTKELKASYYLGLFKAIESSSRAMGDESSRILASIIASSIDAPNATHIKPEHFAGIVLAYQHTTTVLGGFRNELTKYIDIFRTNKIVSDDILDLDTGNSGLISTLLDSVKKSIAEHKSRESVLIEASSLLFCGLEEKVESITEEINRFSTERAINTDLVTTLNIIRRFHQLEIHGPQDHKGVIVSGFSGNAGGLMMGDVVMEIDGQVINDAYKLASIASLKGKIAKVFRLNEGGKFDTRLEIMGDGVLSVFSLMPDWLPR